MSFVELYWLRGKRRGGGGLLFTYRSLRLIAEVVFSHQSKVSHLFPTLDTCAAGSDRLEFRQEKIVELPQVFAYNLQSTLRIFALRLALLVVSVFGAFGCRGEGIEFRFRPTDGVRSQKAKISRSFANQPLDTGK